MAESNYIFAIFPYLRTSKSLIYRDIYIRNSDDTDNLPSDAIQHLHTIREMFYLQDYLKLKKISFAFCDSSQKTIRADFIEKLIEFQNFICYLYSLPDPKSGKTFLSYEHASLFLFSPTWVSKHALIVDNDRIIEILPEAQERKYDARGEIEGYGCYLNNKNLFWVTKGSRIFPPTYHLWINYFQDLGIDIIRFSQSERYSPVIDYFNGAKVNDSLHERLLTAVTWYNKSIGTTIDDSTALVNLSIAFESLLRLNRDNKTEGFKEAINIFLGSVPRIDSWLFQFYKARSLIVHEGRANSLMFVASDDPKKYNPDLEYRSLVSYGRQVFQVCFAAISAGAQIGKQFKFTSLLVPNRERFEKISETLRQWKKTPTERIIETESDVRDIEDYRFEDVKEYELDIPLSAAQQMLKIYLDLNPSLPLDLENHIKEFITINAKKHSEALESFSIIILDLDYIKNFQISPDGTDVSAIVGSLLESVWHYVSIPYLLLRDQNNEAKL
jgi:hypothetical protein